MAAPHSRSTISPSSPSPSTSPSLSLSRHLSLSLRLSLLLSFGSPPDTLSASHPHCSGRLPTTQTTQPPTRNPDNPATSPNKSCCPSQGVLPLLLQAIHSPLLRPPAVSHPPFQPRTTAKFSAASDRHPVNLPKQKLLPKPRRSSAAAPSHPQNSAPATCREPPREPSTATQPSARSPDGKTSRCRRSLLRSPVAPSADIHEVELRELEGI
ncbi:classical arabinogalactan protein 9-like [Malania oleifera]|uniref:classical arabinogalactan protein 9-like n=1 Tax=Malania oleifera TaxID=397392 RepID=UPI0025AEBE03|nr:classical arabinogalactan protein 9-like [Malania oleifera]